MIRKTVVLIFFSICFLKGYSQRAFYELPPSGINTPKAAAAAETDTLGIRNFFTGTPTQYYVQQGGYVAGSNYYRDRVKAQQYNITSSVIVDEVILWFGAKVNNTNSSIKVKLYWLDSLGITSGGLASCPGTVIDSATLLLADITTTGYVSVPFPSHPLVYSFAAGIELDSVAMMAGDSVGLMTTTDGNAQDTEHAWEQWRGGVWHTIKQAWPLDIDFAIWPIIDTSSVGIESNSFFDGIKMSQNQPNPAGIETTIQYEIQNNANVTFEMYDVNGRNVLTINEGQQVKGRHSINITTEKIAAGTYYYSLKADNNRLTKKLVIAK